MAKDYAVAAEIAANIGDEQGAIEGYLRLLEMVEDAADVAQIEEIISDEKNHAHVLAEMQLKYDGGVKEAED